MYCPVDGTEWREGITRCPEHDVELVDEPPEGYEDDDASLLEALGLQGLTGITVVTVAVASVVYALSGAGPTTASREAADPPDRGARGYPQVWISRPSPRHHW